MVKFTALSYIFFVSWTGISILGEWLRLPFLFVLAALGAVFFNVMANVRFSRNPYKMEDSLIPLFLFVFMLSALINPNDSGLHYVMAYFFVFLILYLFVKGVLYSYATTYQIYSANAWGVITVGAFLSINFILSATGVVHLQNMIPRVKEATALYVGELNRGYAFSSEPGIVAFYLNVLGPIALWFLWREMRLTRFLKRVLTCLVAFGWLVTFSAAGWSFLILSTVVAMLIKTMRFSKAAFRVKQIAKVGAPSLVIIFSLVWIGSQPVVQDFAYPIVMKLSLSDDFSSSFRRTERWEAGAGMVLNNPFWGYGPRYFSAESESSTLSWFLMLLVEGGLISFFIMILFLFAVFIRIVKFRHPYELPMMIGFLAGCGHLMVISTFYHPFLWALIAIFYAQQAHLGMSTEN